LRISLAWRSDDFASVSGIAPPQSHEGDAVSVEPIEAVISGELGIESEMLQQCDYSIG